MEIMGSVWEVFFCIQALLCRQKVHWELVPKCTNGHTRPPEQGLTSSVRYVVIVVHVDCCWHLSFVAFWVHGGAFVGKIPLETHLPLLITPMHYTQQMPPPLACFLAYTLCTWALKGRPDIDAQAAINLGLRPRMQALGLQDCFILPYFRQRQAGDEVVCWGSARGTASSTPRLNSSPDRLLRSIC